MLKIGQEINFRNIITECLTKVPSFIENKENKFINTMENNPDELTKDNKYWLKYDSNSCRYDSITFLFFNIFYNYFINKP